MNVKQNPVRLEESRDMTKRIDAVDYLEDPTKTK